ncbi:MAG TPA: fumarylacetoacetate hydrolase family protein, partial [Gaiellaceae bacterium]|nr:fumarylacetoacetate hydrolase family protein [Gaiellaceae bacterium]
MKLVTFNDGQIGRLDDGTVHELEVPSMRQYFERGGANDTGRQYALDDVTLRAPIIPKKFLHTAGNFREHEEESKRVSWSHEIAPWIVFFQNVDAIIGPGEAVVYPEHLTNELDYELELAVVVSTGSVSGVAGFSEDAASLYLKPGDVIEAEIEKIGVLRNPVVSWQAAHGEPA